MGEMRKTPDEIKRGLEHCSTKEPCTRCPMWDECKKAASLRPLWDNALAYIQHLEQENARLAVEADRVEAAYLKEEREAIQTEIGPRLIDAKRLQLLLLVAAENAKDNKVLARALDAFADCVANPIIAPTVEAVPVVRCKECTHRGDLVKCPLCWQEWHDEDEHCFGYYEKYDETKDDGFCHNGTKMDKQEMEA